MSISDLLLKPEAAAQSLNIGRSKIYQLMEAGEIESVKIGRSRRISVKALEAFTERLTQEVRGA
jgi:excisionase family DNA binding protein